jgi:hypothetical protein
MRRPRLIFVAAAAAWSIVSSTAHPQAKDPPFQFGLIGDMPYMKTQEEQFQRVVAALNATELAFVVHVGDAQSSPGDYYPNPETGSLPCTDQKYEALYRSFQSVRHPFVLTPGDNDWTDCHLVREPKLDPLERLAKLRTMFYPDGATLGQRTIAVESQAKLHPRFESFRENLRWSIGDVVFGTLHIVGSNDNFGRSAEMDKEHAERKAANLAWISALFEFAKTSNSRGLVLMAHANLGFENHWPAEPKARYFRPFVARGQPIPSYPTAFADYVAALTDGLENYGKPVAFLHGDTHLFRIDKPLYSAKTGRLFENFTRVETFGDPNTHWVRITIDPGDAQLFRFEARIIPENVGGRPAQ